MDKISRSNKNTSKKKMLLEEISKLMNLWLEWQVVKDEDDLLSFDFKIITKEISSIDSYKVSIPILALYQIAEKYNWLQVLRGPRHRPKDPYELVRFIQLLQKLQDV